MDSPDEWFAAVGRKERLAREIADNKNLGHEVVDACGWACEFALKGLIMRQTRMNQWPDKAARPDLHTHDLWKLMGAAGIAKASVPSHLRGKVRVAMSWNVEHRYKAGRVSRKVARDTIESVFGNDGVIEWLKTL